MKYYWVIYHVVDGEELFVSRFEFLARLIKRLVPNYYILEFYPREYYKDYTGWIF